MGAMLDKKMEAQSINSSLLLNEKMKAKSAGIRNDIDVKMKAHSADIRNDLSGMGLYTRSIRNGRPNGKVVE